MEKEIQSEIDELKKNLEECEKLKNEYLAGWQRSRADLSNYKKEEIKRFEGFLEYAKEEFILKILPILDNFELAASQNFPAENSSEQEKQIIKGFLQIKNQILDFLKSQGVEEIKSAGEKFDPNLHEAIEQIDLKEKNGKSDIIIKEVQKGYKINGKLLRPAKVKVIK